LIEGVSIITHLFLRATLLVFCLSTSSLLQAQLNIYSHRHYDSDKILFKKFTDQTGIEINVVKGSADQLIQRLISEGENSPADILLTVDAGRLHRAKEAGVLQPIRSRTLYRNIPASLRDPDNQWFGLTVRARVIVFSKDRVDSNELSTYEDLANSKWKGRIAVRSSSNIYNQSLMASLIEANGKRKALSWAKSVRKNMARAPRGSDRDQARAVASGIADIAIMNTYYIGKLASSKDPKDHEVVKKIAVFFPNQKDRGTHINVSGAGVTASSKNKKNAIEFIEFLSSPEAQDIFGSVNFEYPVKIENNKSNLLSSWGPFKSDKLNLSILGKRNSDAVKLFDKAGWE
jgi:iron(III) transport system substrate-binding protein